MRLQTQSAVRSSPDQFQQGCSGSRAASVNWSFAQAPSNQSMTPARPARPVTPARPERRAMPLELGAPEREDTTQVPHEIGESPFRARRNRELEIVPARADDEVALALERRTVRFVVKAMTGHDFNCRLSRARPDRGCLAGPGREPAPVGSPPDPGEESGHFRRRDPDLSHRAPRVLDFDDHIAQALSEHSMSTALRPSPMDQNDQPSSP